MKCNPLNSFVDLKLGWIKHLRSKVSPDLNITIRVSVGCVSEEVLLQHSRWAGLYLLLAGSEAWGLCAAQTDAAL